MSRLSGLFLTIILVVANAVLLEIILDLYGVKKHRLFTGLFGTSLILFSFGYSLRKRKMIPWAGSVKFWLIAHEWLAISGSFVIFVHTGTHFRALVPISTLLFMFTTFTSGLLGRFVYDNARAELRLKQKDMKEQGLSAGEIEQKLWSLTVASDALSKWRSFHMPLVSILAIMVIYHAVSALYYAGF